MPVVMNAKLTAVSVVVPAFQEAASIVEALTRLSMVLGSTGRNYEIIVVSDGSTDETAQLARNTQLPYLTVLDYAQNEGKGFALRHGFDRAANPIIAFIDGDLDLDPVVLPSFFDLIDSTVADVVVGSKVHPESQVVYPFKRRLASRAFRIATRLATGLSLGDTQTGIKAMRRDLAAPLIANCTATGFAFDLELLAALSDHGAQVVEAPVILNFDFTSTIRISTALEAFADLAKVSAHRRHLRRLEARVGGSL